MQVLMKSREDMQAELFYSSPQSRKQPFRQHPFQIDFTGVVEVPTVSLRLSPYDSQYSF